MRPASASRARPPSAPARSLTATPSSSAVGVPSAAATTASSEPTTILDKRKWKDEYVRLNGKISLAQRDCRTTINHLASLFQDLGHAEVADTFEQQLTRDRDTDVQKIVQFLQNTRSNVGKLRSLLGIGANGAGRQQALSRAAQHLDVLKALMQSIETDVYEFKEASRIQFEELRTQELALIRELDAYMLRLEEDDRAAAADQAAVSSSGTALATSTPSRPRPRPASASLLRPASAAASQASAVPQQVLDYEAFLSSTGGLAGGWDERDHAHFLRLRARIKPLPMLLERCAVEIPNCPLDRAREHEEWYQELLELQERKRKAIEQWRQRRDLEEREQTEQTVATVAADAVPDPEIARAAYEHQRALAEERRQQIQEWKAKRQQASLEEAELRRQEDLQRRLRQQQAEADRLVLKEKVQDFKMQKQTEKELQLLLEQQQQQLLALSNGGSALTREELELRRNREIEEFTRKRLEPKIRKKAEEERRQQRLEELAGTVQPQHVQRDFSRVVRATSAHRMREQTIREGEGEKPAFTGGRGMERIQVVQRRAIPSWRKT